MPQITKYTGGCHCGAVRYEADLALDQVISCNCSICRKRGWLLAFTSPDSFRLASGEEVLRDYLFNHEVIHHLFCSNCGVASFARGRRPDGAEMIAVNARCLDDVDLDSLTVKKVDGARL